MLKPCIKYQHCMRSFALWHLHTFGTLQVLVGMQSPITSVWLSKKLQESAQLALMFCLVTRNAKVIEHQVSCFMAFAESCTLLLTHHWRHQVSDSATSFRRVHPLKFCLVAEVAKHQVPCCMAYVLVGPSPVAPCKCLKGNYSHESANLRHSASAWYLGMLKSSSIRPLVYGICPYSYFVVPMV